MSAKRWDRFVPYTREDIRSFMAQGTEPVVVQRIRLERDREALYTMDIFLYSRAQHRRMVLQFLTLNAEQGDLRVETPSILDQLDKAWYQLIVDGLSQVIQEMVRNPQLFEQPILVASLKVPDDVSPLEGAGQNRVAPGFAWNELYIHSAKRYLFAAEFCAGGLVLDLGCGSGYGAKFLARTAQQVVAADMDAFTLQYGEETYPDPRIRRIQVSPEQNLPFETHRFDAIVSLEVVEHVPVEQMDAYFAEIGRLLKPDGVLIMSTPNKQIYIHYPDPYHVSLMTLDEFRALLESRFRHVELYGQLRSQGLPHTTMEFEIVPNASDSNEIFVAVCRGYRGAECSIVLPPPTVWGNEVGSTTAKEPQSSESKTQEPTHEVQHEQIESENQPSKGKWLSKDWEIKPVPELYPLVQINGVQGYLMPGDVLYLFRTAGSLPPNATIVEIGSFMGLSAIVMAHALIANQNEGARLYCVDTWQGSPEHQQMQVVKEKQLYDIFIRNIQDAGVDHLICPIRKRSTEAAADFADESVDLIFIDGDHSFEACYADLKAWYPKLKSGGILIGHDCVPGSGVSQALEKFAAEYRLPYRINEPPDAHYIFELSKPFPSNFSRSPSRAPLTVIVHTRNEERNIEACLASVKDWADELIVMDMESTDRTVEIARRYTDKVFSHPLIRDFDSARNVSAQYASHEWILYLDADERMTPKLAQAITWFIQQAPHEVAGVQLPYRNYFLGHWIRHAGGWYPGYKAPMLLRRGRFRWRARVHEGVEVQGTVLRFPADDPTCAIEHHTDPTLAHFFQKLNHYSESEADKLQEIDAPCTWQAIAEAFADGLRMYYDETEGWRDGAFGFLLALCGGLSRMSNWMKYAERLLLAGHSGELLLPPSAADFLQHAANHACSSPFALRSQPTATPPEWWLKLWQRLQRESAGKVLYIGVGNWNHWTMIARDGWQICTPVESLVQMEARPLTETVDLQLLPSTTPTSLPVGTPVVDSLVALGSEWRPLVDKLKPGGLFLIGVSPQPKDIEQWRGEIETAFEATVHLVDPEPACDWLFAFGWKGQRMSTIRRWVLMVAHRHAFEMFGGGETQLLETLIALREQGVRADVSLSLRLQPKHYDLLHLFSLYHSEKLSLLQESDRPVVVSTIFWDYSELRYAATVQHAIFSHSEPEMVHRALEAWREGTLRIEGVAENHFQEPAPLRESQRAVLACAHLLLPNGEREVAMLKRAFGEVPIPIRIVPNAVRPERFLHASPEPFVKRFGLRDFVLCAARVEPNKNQAMLIWALRDTGLPLVIAGPERDPDYAWLCRKWAGASVLFVGELSPDLLASAYAAARVHALPSWSETPGLVNLEAGLAGCALVVGNRGLEQEYLGEYAFVCDPGDWRSIREAVLQAWKSANPERSQACREHILRHLTWNQAAQLTAEAYESLLESTIYWVALPQWDDAANWQPLVEAYVRSTPQANRTILQLYAGPLNNSIPEEVYERVKDFLLQLGMEPVNCPDIEIVNQLILMPGARAILTGSPLDAPLQQLFGDQCITFQDWCGSVGR
jgi:SAM-dependent methyltransferase/glycosyltransferase involved in cell wall biosynthesis